MKHLIIIFLPFMLLGNINFTIAPIDKDIVIIKGFTGFIDTISKSINKEIDLNYMHTYDMVYEDIIKENSNVDIAFVDAYTYIKIKNNTDIFKPIVYFDHFFSCTLFSLDTNIQISKSISFSGQYNICGYQIINKKILRNEFDYKRRNNSGDNLNTILDVMLGHYDFGIVPSFIYKRYQYVGLQNVQEINIEAPYVLLINKKTIEQKDVLKIIKALNSTKLNKTSWHKLVKTNYQIYKNHHYKLFNTIERDLI